MIYTEIILLIPNLCWKYLVAIWKLNYQSKSTKKFIMVYYLLLFITWENKSPTFSFSQLKRQTAFQIGFSFLYYKTWVGRIQKAQHIHFFSALVLGLKKEDMGFMPLLSTLAKVFWAAVIFLGGWNEKRDKTKIK